MIHKLKETFRNDIIAAIKNLNLPEPPAEAVRLKLPRPGRQAENPDIQVVDLEMGKPYARATINCVWSDMPLYSVPAEIPLRSEGWDDAVESTVNRLVISRDIRIGQQSAGIYNQERYAADGSFPFRNVTRDSDDRRIWYPQIWLGPFSHLTQKVVLPEPLEIEPQSPAAKEIKNSYLTNKECCECPILPVLERVLQSVNITPDFCYCYPLRIEVPLNPDDSIAVTVQSMTSRAGVYTDVLTVNVNPFVLEQKLADEYEEFRF